MPTYPFAALIGQPMLTQALLLAAIDAHIGGVLIEGPRGTAKSTAARALAALMAPAPFVTVPLGAALEHVTGTLDLQQALAGHDVRFAPGLLARAHGGVLYVDEINLLPDALVDVLLDAAASGQNVVERDGISHSHAAEFVLIGTMNPEEGALRPQLLDRLGLCVRLGNVQDAATRQAIVRARLAFDADPAAFATQHAAEQTRLAEQLARARQRVQDKTALPPDDAVHAAVTQHCLAAQVDGLRADLVMLRAARALAAWQGDAHITPEHVAQVAELVLTHRRHPDAPAPAPASAPSSSANSAPTSSPTSSPAHSSTEPAHSRPQPPHTSHAGDSDHGNGHNDASEGDWGALPPQPTSLAPEQPTFKNPLAALKPLNPHHPRAPSPTAAKKR